MKDEDIRKIVRENYGRVARTGSSCCGPPAEENPCCAPSGAAPPAAERMSGAVGYSAEEMGSVPEGANLGLGCGNPLALAAVREGDTVLDLGSGAGFDCFLASPLVGPSGRVIGVDMTPDMLERARGNAEKGGYENVEFRLGEIENLPVADASVDMVISNCVINLSPDKPRVFAEAFRVLKPGARLMVSDIVLRSPLPDAIRASVEAYVGCVAGAMLRDDYIGTIEAAGFKEVRVLSEKTFPLENLTEDPTVGRLLDEAGIDRSALGEIVETVASLQVEAFKPAA